MSDLNGKRQTSVSYESLLEKAQVELEIHERTMQPRNKGLYMDGVIWINNRLLSVEKVCALAEEVGHHYTTAGDILDQNDLRNRKQELRARQWAYQCLIPLDHIIKAHYARISGRYDLAEYLGVTEEFLQAAIDRFTEKYGLSVKVDDRHIVLFDPLGVIEIFDK